MALSVGERIKLTRIVVDRSAPEAALAMSAAWIAFVMALPVLDPEFRQPADMLAGALGAAMLTIVGFAVASRVRPMPRRKGGERLRLLGWSLALGALFGITNLAVNLGLASLDPAIHQLLAERFSRISPWTSLLASPVVEEMMFRLLFLSAVAFVVARFVEDQRVVFWMALAVSALVFGVMHTLRPAPASPGLAWIYGSGVTLKSSLAGFLLGWIFWRWGLGYAIAGHFAANAAHLLLEPLVFR
jgi:hypothetical protein